MVFSWEFVDSKQIHSANKCGYRLKVKKMKIYRKPDNGK